MSDYYQRETVEFIPVTVTVDGVPVTSGVEFAVTSGGARPTSWAAPVTIDGQIGVMTSQQPLGRYTVWARISSAPETPVICCGYYTVV